MKKPASKKLVSASHIIYDMGQLFISRILSSELGPHLYKIDVYTGGLVTELKKQTYRDGKPI